MGVELLMMNWMQQKESINSVRKWESPTKILESVRYQINNAKQKKRHHNIMEYRGALKLGNGMLKFTYKEQIINLVDILTMSWMQQRDSINFANKWEFLTKIMESVQYQMNNGNRNKKHLNI